MRLAVAMIVQNDEETIIPCLESFYHHVDYIHITTNPFRGFNGVAIHPDKTMELIRNYDLAGKITITSGEFYQPGKTPIENDTCQRELTVGYIKTRHCDLDWILHIDADEVFADFSKVIHMLQTVPREVQSVFWNWIPVFKKLKNGENLVVCDKGGRPAFEVFPLAHRPHVILEGCRYPNLFPHLKRFQRIRLPLKHRAIRHGGRSLDEAAFHFTFAKSEQRIREKLSTWGHSSDFNVHKFFKIWSEADENWQSMENIHPLNPEIWPRLGKFKLEELEKSKN